MIIVKNRFGRQYTVQMKKSNKEDDPVVGFYPMGVESRPTSTYYSSTLLDDTDGGKGLWLDGSDQTAIVEAEDMLRVK